MPIDPSAVGKELAPTTHEYTARDVVLYALGVGATARAAGQAEGPAYRGASGRTEPRLRAGRPACQAGR